MSMNSSTICCTFFCVCSDIKSIVYSNYQDIFCFYVFLVEITTFGFSRVACSRLDLNLCNPPIFCTPPFIRMASSFLGVFSTNYCIYSISNFWNFPALISKLQTIQTTISALRISYIIKNSNWHDEQGIGYPTALSLWMIWYGNQVLRVPAHWENLLHLGG